MEVLFWSASAVLIYTYGLYYGVLRILGMLHGEKRPAVRGGRYEPTVSIVIAAHNEEGRVRSRLKNLLAQHYRHERLEMLFASDGSSDGTVAAAAEFQGDGVRVIPFEQRRGKAAVLNDLVALARGEIVVFADARQHFAPDAVANLVRRFAEPAVGAVSGELILRTRQSAPGEAVGSYWRYEKAVRKSESRVDSVVGATGAIYAIRRALYQPIPPDTILDDVLIPMRIVRQGYRVVFEPGAKAFDYIGQGDEEFIRKVRTIAGNFQLFLREPWLLSPKSNRLWFQTVSHKGLRLLTPLCLCAMAVSAVAMGDGPLLLVQVVFYAWAAAGFLLRRMRVPVPFFGVPYVVCLLSWATVVAFARCLNGGQAVAWEKASKPLESGNEPLISR